MHHAACIFCNIIYKENSGVLWLGTYDKGLTKYDPETEIYTNYLFEDFIIEGALPDVYIHNTSPENAENIKIDYQDYDWRLNRD